MKAKRGYFYLEIAQVSLDSISDVSGSKEQALVCNQLNAISFKGGWPAEENLGSYDRLTLSGLLSKFIITL